MLAMLRLGQKYNFERFKNEALQQLKDMYPRSLKDLDMILDSEPDSRLDMLGRTPSGQEFKVLNGILELRINTVLPMAYFFCLRARPMVRFAVILIPHINEIQEILTTVDLRLTSYLAATHQTSQNTFRPKV